MMPMQEIVDKYLHGGVEALTEAEYAALNGQVLTAQERDPLAGESPVPGGAARSISH